MYSSYAFQLLTLILLRYTPFAIALSAAGTPNFAAITINNSTSLSAADFSRDVALGIAVAGKAYPSIIPRLIQVLALGPTGEAQPVPFFPQRIALAFQLSYPRVCSLAKPFGKPWEAPQENDVPQDFERLAFDWDRIPMSFEQAQQKLFLARDIPKDQKVISLATLDVLPEDHPSGQARRGDLIYRFLRFGGAGIPYSSVIVDANNGQVSSEVIESMAAGAVQTT